MADSEKAHEEVRRGSGTGTASIYDSASSSGSGDDSPRLAPLAGGMDVEDKTASTSTWRRPRPGSRSGSTYSDPLEPLEHALSSPLGVEEVMAREQLSRIRTATSIGSSASRPPDFEVVFEANDPENPKHWPLWYRGWTIFCVSYASWVVILYSTSYTASMEGIMIEFGQPNEVIATLGVTTYLTGLAMGSLVVAPLSELFGRRFCYIVCLAIFALLVIPCGLANSMWEIILVRFFGALFGAVMISNSPGTVVDIAHEDYLALCMSLWSIAPLNGPVTGPVIGGFVYQYLGWRWDNWLVLILAGVGFCLMATVKETYAPAILKRKAARLRKETEDDRWWCRYDQHISTWDLFKVNLTRPFILSSTEPILWFFNVWISIIYGILYLCFVAYPIVFEDGRGWSPGTGGLAFIGIGVGTMIAILMEPVWRRIINGSRRRDPETGRATPEATAAIMCIGAVLTPIGQLVFSWTCLPGTIHWAIPIAFGVPFGMGNTLSFIYSTNYLAGAYGIYAASALAGNAVMRSLVGGTLPLAGPAMYSALTPQWAGTLLGLVQVCLIPIPFVFYRYGERIRAKSRVIRQMREDQAKNENRQAKQLARLARRADKEKVAAAATAGSAENRGGGQSDVLEAKEVVSERHEKDATEKEVSVGLA